jgi:hypothetical protein
VGTFIHNNPPIVGANSTVTIPAGVTMTIINNFTWDRAARKTAAAPLWWGLTRPSLIRPTGSRLFSPGRTLNLTGTTIVSGNFGADFNMAGNSKVNNSGVFDIQGCDEFHRRPRHLQPTCREGIFRKSSGGSSVIFNPTIVFDNSGLIQSQSGAIGFSTFTQD